MANNRDKQTSNRYGIRVNVPKVDERWGIAVRRSVTTVGADAPSSQSTIIANIGGAQGYFHDDAVASKNSRYWYSFRAEGKGDISENTLKPGSWSRWVSTTPAPQRKSGGPRVQENLDGIPGGELVSGLIRDTSDSRGIRIDADNQSPLDKGWTTFLDLGAGTSSSDTVFKHADSIFLFGDGSAEFGGEVSSQTFTAGSVIFSGEIISEDGAAGIPGSRFRIANASTRLEDTDSSDSDPGRWGGIWADDDFQRGVDMVGNGKIRLTTDLDIRGDKQKVVLMNPESGSESHVAGVEFSTSTPGGTPASDWMPGTLLVQMDQKGSGDWWNLSNATLWLKWGEVERPDRVTGISASWSSDKNDIDVSWNDLSSEDSFDVDRRYAHQGSFTDATEVGQNVTSFSDTDPSELSFAEYVVRGENQYGFGHYGPSSGATRGLAAPSNVAASQLSLTAAEITWTDNSSKESSYNLRRWDSNSGVTSSLSTVASNSTNFIDSTLTSERTYQWTVRAVAEAF